MEDKEIDNTPTEDKPDKALSWTVFPFKDEPRSAILISVFLFVLFVYLYESWGAFYLFLGLVILLGSLWEFFTPVTYTFTESEIEVKTLFGKRAYKWKIYRNFLVDKKGVLLSPFERRTRLERFRGLSIRFDEDKRGEILAYVQRHVAKPD